MNTKHDFSIKSYQDAKNYLQGKKERPLAHNTRIEIDSLDLGHEVITIKYHGNAIVNFFPDGTMTLNSCGWFTSTTKDRINWFLPDGFRIYQKQYAWYLRKYHWSSDEFGIIEDGLWEFKNHMAIKNGEVYNAPSL